MALLASVPFLLYYDVVNTNGQKYCIRTYHDFNNTVYVFTNFVFWYLVPLIFMTIMYTRISIVLWRSSDLPAFSAASSLRSISSLKSHSINAENVETKTLIPKRVMKFTSRLSFGNKLVLTGNQTNVENDKLYEKNFGYTGKDQIKHHIEVTWKAGDKGILTSLNKGSTSMSEYSLNKKSTVSTQRHFTYGRRSSKLNTCNVEENIAKVRQICQMYEKNASSRTESRKSFQRSCSSSSSNVFNVRIPDSCERALLARRRVVRHLIAVVLAFAFCVLPSHVYQMWHHMAGNTPSISLFTASLLPPTTHLILYLNSALNPLLYAFLSGNFRKSLKDLIGSTRRRTKSRYSNLRRTMSMKTAHTLV